MGYLVLRTADRKHAMIIMALENENVESEMNASPPAYVHFRLSDYVPDMEHLLHEHVLVTVGRGVDSEDELNDVIENQLEVDRAVSNVQVCVMTPDIIEKLQSELGQSHMFHLGEDLPLLVILLGGRKALDCWTSKNIEKA